MMLDSAEKKRVVPVTNSRTSDITVSF